MDWCKNVPGQFLLCLGSSRTRVMLRLVFYHCPSLRPVKGGASVRTNAQAMLVDMKIVQVAIKLAKCHSQRFSCLGPFPTYQGSTETNR